MTTGELDEVLDAARLCPICLAHLAPDGSHISALSGARIPAEPAEVTA